MFLIESRKLKDSRYHRSVDVAEVVVRPTISKSELENAMWRVSAFISQDRRTAQNVVLHGMMIIFNWFRLKNEHHKYYDPWLTASVISVVHHTERSSSCRSHRLEAYYTAIFFIRPTRNRKSTQINIDCLSVENINCLLSLTLVKRLLTSSHCYVQRLPSTKHALQLRSFHRSCISHISNYAPHVLSESFSRCVHSVTWILSYGY